MTEAEVDHALSALLETASDVAPELPEELLRKAYAIEKRHQYDRDRAVSMQELEKLVDEYVNRTLPQSRGGAS